MARIRPLSLMSREECFTILQPPANYQGQPVEERMVYLSHELPLRLEKVNEIVWKHYSSSKLDKIDSSRERIQLLADKMGNLDIYNDMVLVDSVLADLLLLFKNYEEMVAYVTLFYHELDDYLLFLANEKAKWFEEFERLQGEMNKIKAENQTLTATLASYQSDPSAPFTLDVEDGKSGLLADKEISEPMEGGIGTSGPDEEGSDEDFDLHPEEDEEPEEEPLKVELVPEKQTGILVPSKLTPELQEKLLNSEKLSTAEKVVLRMFLEKGPMILNVLRDLVVRRNLLASFRKIDRPVVNFYDAKVLQRASVGGVKRNRVYGLTPNWYAALSAMIARRGG